MTDILAITFPIYLVIALGYALVRMQFIKPVFVDGIGQFAVRVGLPLLVFRAIVNAGDSSVINISVMTAYLIATLPLLLVGRTILHKVLGQRPGQSWSLALGIANPNSVMIGLPLASIVFPDYAAMVFASFMLVENCVIIALTLIGADLAGKKSEGLAKTLKGLGKSLIENPLLIAVLLALLARGIGWSPTGSLGQTINLLAQTGPGLALFYIGATVARFSLKGSPAVIGTISFGKLIAHPILALLIFPLFVDDPVLISVCVLFCAIPMLTIYPLLARKSESEDVAATALLVATSLSFVTVTLVLYLL